ncbi:hypothetical protein BEN47_02080 [Hymenobacter lapidarius]|uniref:Uncharacterized protein n=1 Tax=Hymenobacter lapidarius TaxID=1908237 RepID=A0A1G1T2P4_9BACT|nr:hypothetical protein [Hymenobacter lapidarius]OGX85144.1 hypothetical protein BEN47_02080 [Hymenobacter lapidarius]
MPCRLRRANDRADRNAWGCATVNGVPALSRKYTRCRRTVPCPAAGAAANTLSAPLATTRISHLIEEAAI